MALVESLIKEISSVKALLVARSSMHGDGSKVQGAFADALVKKINNLKEISAPDGTALMKLLADQAYGDAGTTKIMNALEAKLAATGAPVQGQRAVQFKSQTLKCWWAFQTQDDLDYYKDPKRFIGSKMCRAVFRANSIGCSWPSEDSLKWMLAMILLLQHDDFPSPRECYAKLNELKMTVVSERKHSDVDAPDVYSDSPTDLPPAIFQSAYPEGDEPVPVELPGINAVADRIPLRSNSKLLRGGGADGTAPASWKIPRIQSSCKQPPDGLNISADGMCTTHGLKQVKDELHDDGAYSGVRQLAQAKDDTQQMPTPNDPQEEALWAQYKADLWKLRAHRQGLIVKRGGIKAETPVKSEHNVKIEPTGDSLNVTTTVGGGYLLRPRTAAAPTAPEVKTEVKSETGSGKDTDGDDEDLDPYAKAAIAAMNSRVSKKRDSAKQKAATMRATAKAKLKAPPKKDGVKNEPGLKKPKAEIVEVSKSQIMQSCPSEVGEHPPVYYNKGVIYTVTKAKMFRALKVKGDRYTEVQGRWGNTLTQKEAWLKVVSATDSHQKTQKPKKKVGKCMKVAKHIVKKNKV